MSQQIKNILEAAIMVADEPLSVERMMTLFADDGGEPPSRQEIREVLDSLTEDYTDRGIELKQVASGYRLQAKSDVAKWVNRLWTQKPPRYTRALLETLAIIAYRQPITRGEIESIRGVSVSSNVIKTLEEREWIKVAGHRDVPGRPAVFATTRQFLDYFNLKSLGELPTLSELRDLDEIADDLFEGKLELVREEETKTVSVISDDPDNNQVQDSGSHENSDIEENLDSATDSGDVDNHTAHDDSDKKNSNYHSDIRGQG